MRKIIYFLVLFSSFILNSCTKDSDVFIPDPGQITGPDSTWYAGVSASMPANVLKNMLMFSPDIDSVTMDNDQHTIIFPSGLECTLQAKTFVANNGSSIDGKVDLEAYFLKKKGDLIRMAKPTISNNKMLVNGGTIFFQGKKEGAVLKLANDKKINFHYNYNYVSSLMRLFTDDINASEFSWSQCADTLNNNNKIVSTATGYDIYTNRLQWMNCNYYYNMNSGDSIKLSLSLPPTFTNANTLVYLVFNDQNSVLAMNGNVTEKRFISSIVPSGKSVTVVTMTKEGNFFYLGHYGFVTDQSSATSTYQNINITPIRVSFDSLKNYLSNL